MKHHTKHDSGYQASLHYLYHEDQDLSEVSGGDLCFNFQHSKVRIHQHILMKAFYYSNERTREGTNRRAALTDHLYSNLFMKKYHIVEMHDLDYSQRLIYHHNLNLEFMAMACHLPDLIYREMGDFGDIWWPENLPRHIEYDESVISKMREVCMGRFEQKIGQRNVWVSKPRRPRPLVPCQTKLDIESTPTSRKQMTPMKRAHD